MDTGRKRGIGKKKLKVILGGRLYKRDIMTKHYYKIYQASYYYYTGSTEETGECYIVADSMKEAVEKLDEEKIRYFSLREIKEGGITVLI